MVKYSDEQLDAVFAALADSTRRAVLASLAEGGRAVTELARPHDMSLPGFLKHLRVLEDAGLVARTKAGRVVSCELQAEPMKDAAGWIAHYRKFWSDKLDALGRFLYQQEELQSWKSSKFAPQTSPRSPSSATTRSRRKKSGAPGPSRKR
ncbi:MAG TPA: metalloregulator ArsR/SmtB family transcription factor [Burkholderiales bacterium]|nr:metalloregulator ArsR/SmtB family transcription factor [Burkholderiales bacterium]